MQLIIVLNRSCLIAFCVLVYGLKFSFAQSSHSEKYSSAVIEYKNGNFSKAILLFSEAIAMSPSNAVYYNDRGISYKELQEYKKAMDDYNHALSLSPKLRVALVNRAQLYKILGDYQNGLKDVNAALSISTSFDDTYNVRGAIHEKLLKFTEALEDFTKAIAINESNAIYYNNRAKTLNELGRYQEALSDCNKAIKTNPKEADFYITKGNTYQYTGQYYEAEKEYTLAISLDPKNSAALYNRALIRYKHLYKDRESIADCTKVIQLNGRDGAAYNIRGIAKIAVGERESGCADLKKSMELQDSNGKANYYMDCK